MDPDAAVLFKVQNCTHEMPEIKFQSASNETTGTADDASEMQPLASCLRDT